MALGLDFPEVVFELVDPDELNMVASFGGFPVRYPHWRFGMEFQSLHKHYEYGLARIYELVINNDPCYAYLMKTNTPMEQKLVMAHVFGHADCFRRNAWVKTLTPARLGVVQRPDFERVLADRPDIAFHVIHTLIHRIRVLTNSVSNLALMDVYGRVAHRFTATSREQDGRRIAPAMSQQKIADRVGASRSMINRILKDLTTGGYIRVGKTEIVLLKALPKRW